MNTTENEETLAKLDRDSKATKPLVDMGLALDKLRNNRDFIKLIVDGYLKDEAVRLVHLKADPNMDSPAHQAAIDRDISAIGVLNQYFNLVDSRARIAGKQMNDIEETRAELLNEQV